jgi:hypothetical protein
MNAALSLTNIYPGFSPGNKVHKYYFGVWTLSGLRVWIFLGDAVSSSILRGNSETECLLEEVDGLDDDDPFFFGEKACSFLP